MIDNDLRSTNNAATEGTEPAAGRRIFFRRLMVFAMSNALPEGNTFPEFHSDVPVRPVIPASPSEPILSLRSVHKCFAGRSVLEDVSFDVATGELLVFLGPSGSGKSTLLKVIAGLDVPDRGSLVLRGKDAGVLPPSKRDCAFAFQSHACYDHWTVKQNLEYCTAPHRADLLDSLLEALDLTSLMNSRPSQLSGGELARVSLLRTLVSPKRILLLDEPLTQLNPRFRSIAKDAIARIHRESKKTILYVTHDLHEAMLLGDRIAFLEDGKVQAIGSPRTVYHELVARGSDYVSAGVQIEQMLFCGSRLLLPTEWKLLAFGMPETGVVSVDESFAAETALEGGGSLSVAPDSCLHAGFSVTQCRWGGGYWELALSNRLQLVLHIVHTPWLPQVLIQSLRQWEDGIDSPIPVWISHAR